MTAARAQREAVAQAVNPAARTTGGPGDPVSLATRIAAALNAPERPDRSAIGLFWATAVTTDGQIIIANSYGVGYISSGQRLPDEVRFVNLDDSIPLAQRVAWATYPWRALAGWAQSNGVGLRAVIGTEDQLRNADTGAAQKKLEPDDIPLTSDMPGRERLAVIAPARAEQLANTADSALPSLLPPAPADAAAPADRSADLWFAVMTPVMSEAPGREIAQLRALLAYADHREELSIHAGHTATDPAAIRAAIADGLYWNHLAALTDAALSAGRSDP